MVRSLLNKQTSRQDMRTALAFTFVLLISYGPLVGPAGAADNRDATPAESKDQADQPLVDGTDEISVSPTITAQDRSFWSFQGLGEFPPPAVQKANWPRTPLDRFVLAQIEANGITPGSSASRPQLIRRVMLDLLGFPPTPDELDAFASDIRPDAYARLVDRLLASPHYGERWGRHWLDIVRFAESYGFEHDLDNAHAYHYRDFVIRALNQDLPYDQFVRWQLAGDELAPDNPLARMATGFLAAGVHNADFGKIQVEAERYDELDDIASTIGTAMLGLSIGCARCHDHKYDPIGQRDYYRFIASFARTVRGEVEMEVGFANAGSPVKVLVAGEGVPPLDRLYNPGPAFFEKVYLLRRGDPAQKLEEISPGFLRVLTKSSMEFEDWHRPAMIDKKGDEEIALTFHRSALAQWITDVDRGAGALLARVVVNRLWQHHFGDGLVETPSDFGARGARPTHPGLLDRLAEDLIHSGWRLKHVHRQIVASSVYKQINRIDEQASDVDPANRLLWRRPARRLEAEAIRDSMLAISGGLDCAMFGPGTLAKRHSRRSIYYRVKRSELIPLMTLFDTPDPLQGIGKRPSTTIAPQALAMMNNSEVQRFSHGFARRLLPTARRSLADAVTQAYRLALGRAPEHVQLGDAMQFITNQARIYEERPSTISQLVDEASLVLWLEAGQLTGKAAPNPGDQSVISVWPDRRGGLHQKNAIASGQSEARLVAEATPLGKPAVRFGTESAVLRVPDNPSLNFGTADFTLTVLFRMDADAPHGGNIFGKDSYAGSGNNYAGYFFQHLRDDRLRFSTRHLSDGKGPVNYLDSQGQIQKGRWHRVTGVRAEGTLAIFLNEAFEADVTLRESEPTNVNILTDLKIGEMDDHGDGYLQGEIVSVLVYNRALMPEEVRSNHEYLRWKYLSDEVADPVELALTDFCQALFCLNDFIYPP